MSQPDLINTVAKLWEIYPNHRMSDEKVARTMMTYAEYLEDIPVPVLQKAIKQVASTKSFFPSVFELRQAADEVQSHNGQVKTTGNFDPLPPMSGGFLTRQAELENEFYNEGELDETGWAKLIADMAAAGYEVSRRMAEQKLENFHRMMAETEQE